MDAVDEIKDRLTIEEVVGRYVDLKRSGSSLKGLCPFHQENTPSFHVSPSRGTYHCFGCGKGGDIFSFVMETQRVAFPDALRQLAEQAGVPLPEKESRAPSLSKRLYEANEVAARFFRSQLESGPGERARQYLEGRDFGSGAIAMFDLGYTQDSREALTQHMRKAGFEDRILLAAGLVLQDDDGGATRDRFRGRLMFPIRDRSGRISGFGGRTLGDSQPKYLNSPQTEIFDKSAVLYGIHRAQDGIREAGHAVLVEGYLDAIRAHLSGYVYTVASLGTAVTAHQLNLLSRLTSTVIVALDPDAAGLAAAARTSLTALAEFTRSRSRSAGQPSMLDLKIARLPAEHGDPDELIRSHSELWEAALNNAVPAFDFYFTQTMSSLDRSSDGWRQEAMDRLLPLIQQFSTSAGWQATWVDRLGRETGIEPRRLQQSLPAVKPPVRRRQPRPPDTRSEAAVAGTTVQGLATDPAEGIERALIAVLLKMVVIPEPAVDQLKGVELTNTTYRAILDSLLDWRRYENYDYQMLRETMSEEVVSTADELYAMETPVPEESQSGVVVAFHLTRLRHFRIQSQHSRASQHLQDVESGDRPSALASLAELMRQRRRVEEDLDRLSRIVLQGGAAPDYGTIDQDSGRL